MNHENKINPFQNPSYVIWDKFPIPIIVTNTKDRILYLNSSFNKIIGYTIEEIPTNSEWITKAYPDMELQDKIRKETPTTYFYPHNQRERKITCKNGNQLSMILQDVYLHEDLVLTLMTDITQWRKIEEEKLEAEKILSHFSDFASEIIVLLDIKGTILSINSSCKTLLGFFPEEMINHDINEFVDSIFHSYTDYQANLKINEGYTNTTYPLDMIKKSGEKLHVEVSSNKVIKNNKIIGIQAIIRDISERNVISNQNLNIEKHKSIALLVGGVAHDFNNILASILGCINLLQLEPSQTEQIELLSDLEKATYQARDLSTQLLKYSKDGIPEKSNESINKIISDITSLILRGKSIILEMNLNQGIPDIFIDKGQISQVISNILINACQAMDFKGKIKIFTSKIEIKEYSELPLPPQEYILVKIVDDGPGIPDEIKNQVFEPYFTTKTTGTGLGLTICYSIIKNHDGFLKFESELGRGTSFFIYLPIQKK